MPDQPHVLLITTDHWPAAYLGIAGHPAVQTPTLDQLARNGTRYSNAYTECPICIPARRTLMTGTSPRIHGDRTFQTLLPMPQHLSTMAETFREAGYQAYGVGKVHVYPQRSRIGFNDILLAEEGRPYWGVWDDYEVFLGDRGFAGRQFDHGMSNNEYFTRTWHLPDDCHVTTWTTTQMARMIRRRDPEQPGFWYLSYTHPHPPLVPLECYWNMYRDIEPAWPEVGEWAENDDQMPYRVQLQKQGWHCRSPIEIRHALRAFYAVCTHIDHSIRTIIGTLREEGILDNTIIMFTADHGDMLGTHGLWAKRLYYEQSANVPMLLMGVAGDERVGTNRVDDRIVGWQDIMPTLLDLVGIRIPDEVTGLSMVAEEEREYLYAECNEGKTATRMIRSDQFKLIYYPVGNRTQLFNLQDDPLELEDLANVQQFAAIRNHLTECLIQELYGSDCNWLEDEQLVGLPDRVCQPDPNRGLSLQRGIHWPPPPVVPPEGDDHPSRLK